MKDGFAFLYQPPRSLRCGGGSLDIRSVCYPLEIFKKFGFLFDHFGVGNRSRGLQVVVQERPSRTAPRGPGPGDEEYAIECGPERVVLSADSARGQFYALSTLLQVLARFSDAGRMPAFSLRDSPLIAFRGAYLAGEAAQAGTAALQRLLLQLALLRFNHMALPAAAGDEARSLAALAQRTGMVVLLLDTDPRSLASIAVSAKAGGSSPASPAFFPGAVADDPGTWLEFFLERCRAAGAAGARMAVWSDLFLERPEWIRRIPGDALVLNRTVPPGRGDHFRAAVLPFKEHHVRQVLCPGLCDRGRFMPDARAALERVAAAMDAVAAGKLAGVMLAAAAGEGSRCLPAGSAMVRFQAACLLWSGRPPSPDAFGRWALGRDDPDLFRIFSFLAQAEHRLPHAHGRYFFEDPLLAPFSRQADAREIVAHFRKAAQYLRKKEVSSGAMSGFFDFIARLYAVIADKVQLSSRLAALLETAAGGEAARLQAAGLQQAVMELKGLYAQLRGGAPPQAGLKEFDMLGERFIQLGRAAADADARDALLTALRNNVPLNAAETLPRDNRP